MGSKVKESSTGRIENWVGLWTEFGHPWKAKCFLKASKRDFLWFVLVKKDFFEIVYKKLM